MKTRQITILAFMVFSLLINKIYGQQDPQITHYMYNMSTINPAYSTDAIGYQKFGLLYRTQWVGIDNAPDTGMFFFHSPLTDKIEAGFNLIHDTDDIQTETNVNADFAYKLQVTDEGKLAFGLKAGATFFNTDFNGFFLNNPNDPAFDENISRTYLAIGVGGYYYTDKFYLGLSTPNLLKTKHLENETAIQELGGEEIHYYLTSGYVFDLSDNIELKPSVMIKAVAEAPITVDVNANVRFYETVEVGLGYRNAETLIGMVNFEVADGIRIGYAYDRELNELKEFNDGTHEFMLLFDLNIFGHVAKYIKSPRFF